MEIIFQGQQNTEEAAESFLSVLRLFKERYQIESFREIHLSVTLLDKQGDEVELIDSDTSQPYRFFEVYRTGHELVPSNRIHHPSLKLVVDNVKSPKS